MRKLTIVGLTLVGFAAAGCSTVEDIASADIAGSTLSAVGLISPQREKPEDPKPRGPLVAPGTKDLPAPREAAVNADPAWPKDSDRAEEIAEQQKIRRGNEYRDRMANGNVVLAPNELAGGYTQNPREYRPDPIQAGADGVNPQLSREELKSQSDLAQQIADQQSGRDTSERRYLIDPPSDHRQLSNQNYEGREEILAKQEPEKKRGLGRLWPF